ncbi:MAG: NADPH-dependent FMN reductase [Ferruginibacter sp.]
MKSKKNILTIVGSAGTNSSNLSLVKRIRDLTTEHFTVQIFDQLSTLPHFDPALSVDNTPYQIQLFRAQISNADGVIICTPEYVFSIPSGLKNALEWCVSTILFSDKPLGIITASADGRKGHEELQLIMKTIGAIFNDETTLLIQGIKGKFDAKENLTDERVAENLASFLIHFAKLVGS